MLGLSGLDRGARMKRRRQSHRLIAALLSLMVLVTFSAAAVADCGMPMPGGDAHHHDQSMMADGDCHEAGDADCPHAMPAPMAGDCVDADDCGAVVEALAPTDRKPVRDDVQPDIVVIPVAAAPTLPRQTGPPSAVPASPVDIPEPPRYLLFGHFLE